MWSNSIQFFENRTQTLAWGCRPKGSRRLSEGRRLAEGLALRLKAPMGRHKRLGSNLKKLDAISPAGVRQVLAPL
jgi:hypothetical protein